MNLTIKKIASSYDRLFRSRGLENFKDITSFVIITLIIHFGWRFWEIRLNLFPFSGPINGLMDWLSNLAQQQSEWVWNHVFGYQVKSEGKIIRFPSCWDISIGRSCSGVKQIMQFVILMICFRGPWIKKLWFIPMGIVLVHLTNILRIVGTGIFSMNHPTWMKFMHDNVLRWLFYLVICGLWLWWVKKIAPASDQPAS